MPFIVPLLIGLGGGAYFGAQGDDAIEVATGEKGGVPWVPLLIVGVVVFFIWRATSKKGAAA